MPYVEDIRRTKIIRDIDSPMVSDNFRESLQPVQPANIPAISITYLVAALELLLALRFVFRMLGANRTNAVVDALYSITAPLVQPFSWVFPNSLQNGTTLEWSTLLSMLVLAVLGGLLISLLRRSTRPVEQA